MIDISKYIIHDLTHTLNSSIAGYSDTPARELRKDGWNAKWLKIYSHTGTHMDAPHHFEVSDQTIDQYTPEMLMGKAWIVRVAISEHRQLLGLDLVKDISDEVQAGDSLLIQTLWSHEIANDHYKDGLPRISKQLAEWCVAKHIKILGVEPPSVADVNNLPEVTEIHEILLGGNVIIVEGLVNLEKIKKDEVFLIALPLKIENGDGAPARVIAFESR